MNHKDKLLEIYNLSYSVTDIKVVDLKIKAYIETIGNNIHSQKGVFTVLVTLLIHKLIDPKQDIRNHQSSLVNGFSGRTIDTKYITPTLKELGLPSMAESGWLTRSLEQPFPYILSYNGKISNKAVKEAFLNIIDNVEIKPKSTHNILRLLLNHAIIAKNNSKVTIIHLENSEKLTIENITFALNEHFKTKYNTHGGSKLPVLAFFAIYQSLIKELSRYRNCTLSKIGSHTASDKNSKTAGDIEIFKKTSLFEAIEIKLDKEIDLNMIRIAIEKINIYNPQRYYILSYKGIKENDKNEIKEIINKFQVEHGCQIIINGLLPTIKYYLRLITSLNSFISNYNFLVENDNEIKVIHKEVWNNLLIKYLLPSNN